MINFIKIKRLINESVQDAFRELAPRGYLMKKQFLKIIVDGITANVDLIESQNEYEDVVDQEIQKIKQDLDVTLEAIGRTLYRIPFQDFKSKQNNP